MTTSAALSYYMKQADLGVPVRSRQETEARIEAGKWHEYGGDASIAGLRAFIRYHKHARVDLELGGKLRSLTHKQMAVAGLVARISVTQEHATVTSIAREANVVPSTVSRFLLKLQCWNVYAIDVTRGRNGGVTVRLRRLGDQLAAYAERAWERIRRSARNVASRIPRRGEGFEDPKNEQELREQTTNFVSTYMDATFSEVWGDAERRGAVLALEAAADKTPTLPRSTDGFDPGRLTAINVIEERWKLAIYDPEGEQDAVSPMW